jgi:lipoprotein-anchoring transpeptidase ErfK/SrfK
MVSSWRWGIPCDQNDALTVWFHAARLTGNGVIGFYRAEGFLMRGILKMLRVLTIALCAASFSLATIVTSIAEPAQAFSSRVYTEASAAASAGGGGGTKFRNSDKSPIARRTVNYKTKWGPNTIIIDTSERRLYYTLGNGKAIKYGVGVGKDGFTWTGVNKVSRKAQWPGWTPPPQMIAREAKKGRKLPAHMKGGPNNPLGARALYIGSTLYRIHGTNQPWTIGQAMSSGCIRMANEDVIHLYNQAKVGTRVVVQH